jgi:hypothetical protein
MTSQPSLPGRPIDLPLPPELAETFGYSGNSRFVAFFWRPSGDQVVFDDGRSSGTGNSWTFLSYRRHRVVAPLLEEFNLGYSDLDAEDCLVIDRERNIASIAPIRSIGPFLQAQHPPAPELSQEQVESIRRHIAESLERRQWQAASSAEAMSRALAEQRGRLGRMVAWLDQCPVPPGRGHRPGGPA